MELDKDERLKILNELLKSEKEANEKKYILNLKKNYLKNSKINNLEEVENKIYNGKNNKEKFYFELKRIHDWLSLSSDEQALKDLNVLYARRNAMRKRFNDEEKLYFELLLNIIEIEINLKMKIGLVKKFNDYVDYYINKSIDRNVFYEDDFSIKDKKVYSNKK